jgi:hypothetical protein
MVKPKEPKTDGKKNNRGQAFPKRNTLNLIVFPSFDHEKPARFSLRKKDAEGGLNQNV